MKKSTDENLLQSGTIKVEQQVGKFQCNIIWQQSFTSRKELQKLLFQLKGSPVVVIVRFDEDKEDLEAGSEP